MPLVINSQFQCICVFHIKPTRYLKTKLCRNRGCSCKRYITLMNYSGWWPYVNTREELIIKILNLFFDPYCKLRLLYYLPVFVCTYVVIVCNKIMLKRKNVNTYMYKQTLSLNNIVLTKDLSVLFLRQTTTQSTIQWP